MHISTGSPIKLNMNLEIIKLEEVSNFAETIHLWTCWVQMIPHYSWLSSSWFQVGLIVEPNDGLYFTNIFMYIVVILVISPLDAILAFLGENMYLGRD